MARFGEDGGPVTWVLAAAAGLIGVAMAAASLRAFEVDAHAPPIGPATRYSLVGVGLIMVAGFAVGRTAGSVSASSCVAGLRGGEDVVARGLLLDPIPTEGAHGARRRITIRLGHVRLAHSGRRCKMRRLGARVLPTGSAARAGNWVVVGGVWRAYPRSGSLPISPDRYGVIQGQVLALAATDGSGAPSPALGSSRLAARLREGAADRLGSSLAPETLATGRALILADRTTLDPTVRARFRDAGIGHLLAISGLHIGALAGGALWCLGLWLKDWRRYPIAVLGTGLYVLLIGAPPSAVRAFLLFAGYAGARLRGAPASLGDLAGLAVVVALLFDPLVILHPSFQLSFAGFAGIIAGGTAGRVALTRLDAYRNRSIDGRWRGLVLAVIGSLAAFLFTAPFAAAHFGRIVPAAILSSIVGSSLVALALPALILALVLPGPLGSVAGAAASATLRLLDAVAARFAAMPLHWDTPTFGPSGWLALIGLAATLALLHSSRRGSAILLAGGICSAWIGGPGLLASRGGGHTLVCSLDVGQGDATVVRTRRGRWVLIDAGPGGGFLTEGQPNAGAASYQRFRADPRYGDAGRGTIVPFLRGRGVRYLELLVLSHAHLDHFGGSEAVLDRFRVRRVLDAGFAEPNAAYSAFLERLDGEGALWLPAGAWRGERTSTASFSRSERRVSGI
jgi:ComEC/Rec2-related protein